MTEPALLAWTYATGTLSRDELAEFVHRAELNAPKVMPPLAAEWMARELHDIYVDVMYGAFMWWKRLEAWVPRIDEINTYAWRLGQGRVSEPPHPPIPKGADHA